jgi:hypothetical protein
VGCVSGTSRRAPIAATFLVEGTIASPAPRAFSHPGPLDMPDSAVFDLAGTPDDRSLSVAVDPGWICPEKRYQSIARLLPEGAQFVGHWTEVLDVAARVGVRDNSRERTPS